MAENRHIAGVVLAGGRSSRMGQNKALLDYHGKPLVEHMIGILRECRIEDIFISGTVTGHICLEDSQPHKGPAFAIRDIFSKIPGYQGYLFVPVDMPRLSPIILQTLLSQEKSCYFTGHPLPVFLTPPLAVSEGLSVQSLVDAQGISPLAIHPSFEGLMINTNTPQEWREALSTS